MNPTKVIELLKEKQYARVIRVCEFEMSLTQSNLEDWFKNE